MTIRQVGDPVSSDPSFWYEILDDRGINLLGRIAGTTLQLQRWSTELQTWVLEYYAVSNLPQDPFPLLPQTEYRFSELPALLTVRDFYGTKLDQVPPLSIGEYRVAFSINADYPVTVVVAFAVGDTNHRASGIQISPEGTHVIVTKDVGEERWVIFHFLQFGTIMGNVYFRDGREPVVLFCKGTAESTGDYSGTFDYECHASDSCEEAPCGTQRDWHFIANVTLPGTFFLPAGQDRSPIAAESRTLLTQDLRDELASYGIEGLFTTRPPLSSVAGVGQRESGIQVSRSALRGSW